MKDLSNKGGKKKNVEIMPQAGDGQIWYKQNLGEDNTFNKNIESTQVAEQQPAVNKNIRAVFKDITPYYS